MLAGEVADKSACQAQPIGFNPYAPKSPNFKPRATAVISLFMSGGASSLGSNLRSA